jgi:transcriptional regulator with XRE-family HTH domain
MRDDQDPVKAIGRLVKSLRTTIGWSQRGLGARAGLSQSMVCLVERGSLGDLTFSTASVLLESMGARLVVSADAPYLGDRQRQRDPAHARLSAYGVARLRRSGWLVRTEVEIGGNRSRGWIDILAIHPSTGLLLVIELKTEIRDLGGIERSLGWYEREAWAAARRLGWRPRRVLGCLLLLATQGNELRLTANRASIDLGFPMRARHLGPIVSAGTDPDLPGRAIAMIDPRSKRRAWCGPLRIDGRRSAAPYLDYADFVRSVETGLRRSRRGQWSRAAAATEGRPEAMARGPHRRD